RARPSCRTPARSRSRRSRARSSLLLRSRRPPCPPSRKLRPRRSAAAPARAARQPWRSSATRSLQVGDERELLDGVAVQREVGPLAALLSTEQAGFDQLLEVVGHRRL